MFELFFAVISLVFLIGMFLVFDSEILYGHVAKKIRKYLGIE